MILTREKVAVVTGASTGMGRELAVRLRKEGCSLALCDINIQELEMTRELLEAIPSQAQVTLHTVDVSNRADVARFAREVQSAHGPAVHLLFNNAGIVRPIAFDVRFNYLKGRNCGPPLNSLPLPLPLPLNYFP